MQLKTQQLEPDVADALEAEDRDRFDLSPSDLNLGIAVPDKSEVER